MIYRVWASVGRTMDLYAITIDPIAADILKDRATDTAYESAYVESADEPLPEDLEQLSCSACA